MIIRSLGILSLFLAAFAIVRLSSVPTPAAIVPLRPDSDVPTPAASAPGLQSQSTGFQNAVARLEYLEYSIGWHAPDVAREFITALGATVPAGFTDGALINLIKKDAAGTLEWASLIDGEREGTGRVYDQALRIWIDHDQQAAERWLAEKN